MLFVHKRLQCIKINHRYVGRIVFVYICLLMSDLWCTPQTHTRAKWLTVWAEWCLRVYVCVNGDVFNTISWIGLLLDGRWCEWWWYCSSFSFSLARTQTEWICWFFVCFCKRFSLRNFGSILGISIEQYSASQSIYSIHISSRRNSKSTIWILSFYFTQMIILWIITKIKERYLFKKNLFWWKVFLVFVCLRLGFRPRQRRRALSWTDT